MKHNKRIFAAILAMVLVLGLVLTACKSNEGGSISTPTVGNSKPTGTSDGNDKTTPVGTSDGNDKTTSGTGNETKIDYNKVYEDLISQWKSVLNKYKSNEYTADDMLDLSFYIDDTDTNSVEAYYALYDIDGNGITELILNKRNSYEDIIAYIFTIKDGKPINVFGYNEKDLPIEVPWSRTGSSSILNNGLIDSNDGDWSIYKIADDGYTIIKVASSVPYDYPDMASLDDAKWRYYINDIQVDYDFYVEYLDEQGYTVNVNNTLAVIDWINVD